MGDGNVSDLPSGTLSSSSFVTAAYSAAKILKSVDRIRALQQPQEAAQFEGVVVPTASIDEQIQDAMEILGVEDALRRNNVVSSDVREADEKIEKLSSDSVR